MDYVSQLFYRSILGMEYFWDRALGLRNQEA